MGAGGWGLGAGTTWGRWVMKITIRTEIEDRLHQGLMHRKPFSLSFRDKWISNHTLRQWTAAEKVAWRNGCVHRENWSHRYEWQELRAAACSLYVSVQAFLSLHHQHHTWQIHVSDSLIVHFFFKSSWSTACFQKQNSLLQTHMQNVAGIRYMS